MEISNKREGMQKPICREAFLSEEFETYLAEFQGDISADIARLDYVCGYQAGTNYYVIAVRAGMLPNLLAEVKGILNADISLPYTLTEVSPLDAANITIFHGNSYLVLRGTGTVAAIIDTGIDYLNPQFIDNDGNSRILTIWDQTIISEQIQPEVGYGTVYTREQINAAIKAQQSGGDPYAIVPHKDLIGHGTHLAGIVGAKGLNGVTGGAPECEFVIVKLKEAKMITLKKIGINERKGPIYEGIDYFEGVRFVSEYQSRINKPMGILLSLGTNLSGHDGVSSIERFVNYYGSRKAVVFVAGTGNQGDEDIHASGSFTRSKQLRTVELLVGENEQNLIMSLWFSKPDRVSVGVVSPSGEIIEPIPPKLMKEEETSLVLEESVVKISYSFPEESTGDEFVLLSITNPKEGLWQIRLRGEYIVNGTYNIWLPQRQLLQPHTRFLDSNPNITLTSPSAALAAISTGYYNQNNNTVATGSGRGPTRDGRVKPEVASGGIGAVTTGVNNTTEIVSGASVAGSVLTSAVLLLLQWGIVEGNDPNMYGPKLKAYITRGARRRPGDIYPNYLWGFGTLNLLATFQDLRFIPYRHKKVASKLITLSKEVFFNMPLDMYSRLVYSIYDEDNGYEL